MSPPPSDNPAASPPSESNGSSRSNASDRPDGDQADGVADSDASYVSTPMGIFTERGIWFHVPEDALRSYAGDILDVVPMDTLVEWSSAWLRSPRILTLWLLPLVLWITASQGWSPAIGAGIALAFHLLWTVAGPSMVSTKLVRVLRWMENVLAQALVYVFSLSALAAAGAQIETVIGLTGFVALRYGVLDRAASFLTRPVRTAMYDLPLPDQILRAFLIRIALNHRLPLPQVDDLASEMLDRWGAHKKK